MSEPETTTASRRGRGAGRRRLRGLVLVLIAVVFLGWSGWSYWQAEQDDSLGFARARDDVLRVGKQRIADLNSMDGRQIDAGLQRWLDASTGSLHDELRRTQEQSRQQLQLARTSTQGSVVDASVTALDTRAGTAQVIASVQVNVVPEVGAPHSERKRYEAGLTRTPDGWKLRSLTAIPVSAG